MQSVILAVLQKQVGFISLTIRCTKQNKKNHRETLVYGGEKYNLALLIKRETTPVNNTMENCQRL